MAQLPSSPQPARRTLDSLKKLPSSNTHKSLFGTATGSSSTSSSSTIDPSLAHPSPALSPASAHIADRSASRRSNSSSQSGPFVSTSSSQTPPGTWSVSGKLVRKKASGLFREAARSWGRSKSKEVLSFGLGVLIGNQDAQAANNSPHPQPTPPPQPPLPSNSSILSYSPSPPTIDQHPNHATANQASSSAEPTLPSSAGTIGKGPKKRISFHSCKKVKGKPKDNAKIVKRRSEIGFGDWAGKQIFPL